MKRHELIDALDFIFTHPVMQKRLENAISALRRRGMDDESRGVVLGHLEILDYLKDREGMCLLNDLYPEEADTAPLRAPFIPNTTSLTTEEERVAPLPQSSPWDYV